MNVTPGPWYADKGAPERVIADIGAIICVMAGPHSNESIAAEASLIAAAPDLLAACEAVLEFLPTQSSAPLKTKVRIFEVRRMVDEAIAKAKGEE